MTGMALTIVSALFAVVGLVTAIEASFVAGLLIVAASIAFWGYTCLLSDLVERRKTPT